MSTITATAIRIPATPTGFTVPVQGVALETGVHALSAEDLGLGSGDHFRTALIPGVVVSSGLGVRVPVLFYAYELENEEVTVLVDLRSKKNRNAVTAEVVAPVRVVTEAPAFAPMF